VSIPDEFGYRWRQWLWEQHLGAAAQRIAVELLDVAYRTKSLRITQYGERWFGERAHVANPNRAFKAIEEAGLISRERDPQKPKARTPIVLSLPPTLVAEPVTHDDDAVPPTVVAERAPEPDLGDLELPPTVVADEAVENGSRAAASATHGDAGLPPEVPPPWVARSSEVQELLTSNRSALPTTARPRPPELPHGSFTNGALLDRVLAVATSPASAHVLRAACTGQPDAVLATALESLANATPDNAAAYLTATIRAIAADR
jgi:hypothetical protein